MAGVASGTASRTGTATVVPVLERFIDDCETPVSAFLKLRADPELGGGPVVPARVR